MRLADRGRGGTQKETIAATGYLVKNSVDDGYQRPRQSVYEYTDVWYNSFVLCSLVLRLLQRRGIRHDERHVRFGVPEPNLVRADSGLTDLLDFLRSECDVHCPDVFLDVLRTIDLANHKSGHHGRGGVPQAWTNQGWARCRRPVRGARRWRPVRASRCALLQHL